MTEQLDDHRSYKYRLTPWGRLLLFADEVVDVMLEQNPNADKPELVDASYVAIIEMAPCLGRLMLYEIDGFDYKRVFDNGLTMELSLISVNDS